MKILNLREVSDLLMVGDMRDEAGISTKYLVISLLSTLPSSLTLL